ncbi:MAG: hypothetical protein NUV74_05530 [Candidatus Brocadiaceae bacterium]|nr:hypothetical protein [Candidatus Brocadiaceae bacterium]
MIGFMVNPEPEKALALHDKSSMTRMFLPTEASSSAVNLSGIGIRLGN